MKPRRIDGMVSRCFDSRGRGAHLFTKTVHPGGRGERRRQGQELLAVDQGGEGLGYIGGAGVKDGAAIVTANDCKTERVRREGHVQEGVLRTAGAAAAAVFAHDIGRLPARVVGVGDANAQARAGVERDGKKKLVDVLRGEGPGGFETQAGRDTGARPNRS